MSSHKIIFDVHKTMFRSKAEGFRRYTEELERKFEKDLKHIESSFDFDACDEDYIGYIEALIDEKMMVEDTFINQYRSSTLVSIYALLEHRMNILADLMGNLNKSDLVVSDLSGDGITRNRKYLEKVCGLNLSKLNGSWSKIQDLNKLRNCIVHCESDITKSRSTQTLTNIINNSSGLRLVGEKKVVIALEYLESAIDLSEEFFYGVVDSSYAVYKTYNKSSQQVALKRASA